MNSKRLIALAIITLSLAALAAAVRYLTPEDAWLCEDSGWIRHGNPSAPRPESSCPAPNEPNLPPADDNATADEEEGIRIDAPRSGEEISGPLIVAGEARGGWYFEASFPARLEDENGNRLASGPAAAQDDSLTDGFVPFRARLDFQVATTTPAFLVLEKDNPSGLPENAGSVRLPVILLPSGAARSITVRAYFNNDRLDPQVTCTAVFPVDREVPETAGVARAALDELLKGATAAERERGYYSNLNDGIRINSLSIGDGVARADFNSALDYKVGGSCRVSAIRAQITSTLKQFPTVHDVIISINGQREDILQP